MVRMALLVVVVLGAGLGCGGAGGGAALDCAWLAGDNCWKMTAAQAVACLPPTAETGTLSADNKTCTYASGAVVTFARALVLPIPNQTADWSFTISRGGTDCLHYEASQAGLKLAVMGQTVSERATGGLSLAVVCPDGTSASTANAFDLLDCNADAGVSFGGLPGNVSSSTSTSVSVGLIGAASASLPLFNCQK
jgi:hypothetical protein